ncbi:hypothetical protein EDC04DRAFT_458374 [Pisolithus marmoratus]|nr:hypothetical protein EDC04DRAFT_458374 [Pisolithus marmoratus]
MDGELAQLRAEFDRLHKRECELQQELLNVHTAEEAKRKLIDDTAKLQPVVVIDHLPVGVLVRILDFALYITCYSQWHKHCIQKHLFAAVSRCWRDIIMTTPSLWTTICVCPTWPSSLVEMHIERSREYPLAIAVLEWRSVANDNTFPGPVLSCTRRWRSLTIRASVVPTQSLLRNLSSVSLPCLKRIQIESYQDVSVEFPATDNTPVLEQLVLKNCRPAVALVPSLEKLTTLVLHGQIGHWQLGPQSIHMPLLRSLTIHVDCSSMLLQAIVVPGLSHFEASLFDVASLFGEIPLVFNEVHHLCLRASIIRSVAQVCQAFPNVRHFEVGTIYI